MADCNLLILELKNHEKLEENVDPLISKLHQKGLLHEDVSGSTAHERAEKLVADLNRATSDGCSESLLGDFLEVLEAFSAFNNITEKFRTNTELKKPQQETSHDSGIPYRRLNTQTHLTVQSLVDPVLKSKQEKSPELFSNVEESRHKLYEASAEISGSPQKESHKTTETANSTISALKKELDRLRLRRNKEVDYLKYKLIETEQRAEHAEQQIAQQEREHQIERSASYNQIERLREKINQLDRKIKQLEFKAEKDSQLTGELLKAIREAQEKVCVLQTRVNELELEKGDLQTRAHELESEKGALQTRAHELESEKGALQTRVDELESEKGALQTRVDELESEKGALQTRVDELESEKGALQTRVDELESEKGALQTRVDELESEKGALQTRVDELELEWRVLQARVEEFELEKEENSLSVTRPIIQLKPFFKDVEPTAKEPLGTGCFGSVFEVQCKLTGACYAAKKFRNDLVKEKDFDKKFHTEFTLLHQLKHDNIVCYVGYTILQGCLFPALLMEQLNTNLHDYLEKEPDIPLTEKVYILLGVGEGLKYLHEKKVLHRDLTAKNVLLDKSERKNLPIPKIADFGNSYVTNTNPIYELESSKGLPGTELYQPPEARRERHSHKLDIFSFGHLSLFVCTQTFPCDKLLDSTYMSTLGDGREIRLGRSAVEQRQYYFAELAKLYKEEYRRPLEALMFKCLDNTPAKRPSARDVVCELKKLYAPLSHSDDVDSPNADAENEYWLKGIDIR